MIAVGIDPIQTVDDSPHRRQRKAQVVVTFQRGAPGVEHHDGLCPGGNLGIQVVGRHPRDLGKHGIERRGFLGGQPLDMRKLAAGTAFDHVGTDSPRTAGEADQRHLAVELPADQRHGIEHVAQRIVYVRLRQALDIGRAAQRALEFGPFAADEVQPEAHGVRHRQDVGEQDRRVQRIASERLQRDLAGQLRIRAQAHEVAGLLPYRTILGQIPAGLAHDPDRRSRHRLALEGAEEKVVFQRCRHGRVPAAMVV